MPNRHDPDNPSDYYGLYIGYVIDRDDPKGLGRVRVCIPGLIDEGTSWARQLGLGGGAAKNGTKFVPPLNAEVAVFFANGDIDQPYFLGGPPGLNEGNTGDDASPDVRTIETASYVISIDERPESKSLTLWDKESEDYIQMNGVARSIAIKATSQIDIKCAGFIRLDGLEVFINGVQAGLGKI